MKKQMFALWLHRLLFSGQVKKAGQAGGPVQIACDVPEVGGASWNPRGVVIFTADIFEPLHKAPEGGGPPERSLR